MGERERGLKRWRLPFEMQRVTVLSRVRARVSRFPKHCVVCSRALRCGIPRAEKAAARERRRPRTGMLVDKGAQPGGIPLRGHAQTNKQTNNRDKQTDRPKNSGATSRSFRPLGCAHVRRKRSQILAHAGGPGACPAVCPAA